MKEEPVIRFPYTVQDIDTVPEGTKYIVLKGYERPRFYKEMFYVNREFKRAKQKENKRFSNKNFPDLLNSINQIVVAEKNFNDWTNK